MTDDPDQFDQAFAELMESMAARVDRVAATVRRVDAELYCREIEQSATRKRTAATLAGRRHLRIAGVELVDDRPDAVVLPFPVDRRR